MFATVASALAKPNVVAAVVHVRYYPGTRLSRFMEFTYNAFNALSFRFAGRPTMVLASALSFRRSAFLASGGYETGLPYSGDEYGVLKRLSRVGRIAWMPSVAIGSSDRRFRGRAFRFLLDEFLLRTVMDRLVYRLTGRSPWGARADVRKKLPAPKSRGAQV